MFWLNFAIMLPAMLAGSFLFEEFDRWSAVVLLALFACTWGFVIRFVVRNRSRRKRRERVASILDDDGI